MMLRSSSTPVLGSLLSSASALGGFAGDSPCTIHHLSSPATFHSVQATTSFTPTPEHSNHSSAALGIRRTRSDGNLRSLVPDPITEPRHQPKPTTLRSSSSSRHPARVLESIPSFSIHSYSDDEEEVVEDGEKEDEEQEVPEYFLHGFSRSAMYMGGGADQAIEDVRGGWSAGGSVPPLFLARGLGIDRIGSGLFNAGGQDWYIGFDGEGGQGGGKWSVPSENDGGDRSGLEAHYKKMVEENPSDALFLANYADFLYNTKGDCKRAEEYYSRAILADPGDGEILSKYAKLIWQLHKDQERASGYFHQAVRAAPNDSNVIAAYAGFLWEAEETEGEENTEDGWPQDQDFKMGSLPLASFTI